MAEIRALQWVLEMKDNATKQIKAANKEYERLKGTIKEVGKDTSMYKLGEGVDSLGKKISAQQKNIQGFAKQFKGVSLVGTAALGAMTKASMDFSSAMSEVQANASATTEEMEKLESYISGMDKRATDTAMATMGGTYASAGFTMDQIEGMLSASDIMMAAGATEATTAGAISLGVKLFDVDTTDTERIVDVFSVAKASADQTLDDVNAYMSKSAGTFKNMNTEMEQGAAMSAVFADANLKGAEAGTATAAIYTDLVNKAEKGKVAIGDMAVSLYDSTGKMRSMPDVLLDITEATSSMTEEQKNAALAATFGASSMKGVNAFLLAGTDRYYELEEAMYSAEGAGQAMADAMTDNLASDLELLKNTVIDTSRAFGAELAPDIRNLVQGATGLVEKVREMNPEMKKTIGIAIAIAAASFPVIHGIGLIVGTAGKAISIFGGLIKAAGMLLGVLKVVGTFLLANPIVIGLGLIVAAGIAVVKNWETISTKFTELKDKMSEGISTRVEAFTQGFHEKMDRAKEKWTQIKEFLKHPIKGTMEIIEQRREKFGNQNKQPSHRTGANTIPYDGYNFTAHKDEMVLTRSTAEAYRKAGGTKDSLPNETQGSSKASISIPSINVSIGSTSGKENAYEQGVEAGKGVRDEIDKYFRDLGIVW